jgi:hypothetical protein
MSMLHIVFNPSGAAGLRDALKDEHRPDRVIALMDSLSFGPINPPDGGLRSTWVEDILGYTGWEAVTAESDEFWQEALSPRGKKVVWVSRRSASEYSGFLEFLWRLGDAPCELIDLTDTVVKGTAANGATPLHPAISLGVLPPYQIRENRLFDQAQALSTTKRDRYRQEWAGLREENAPFRILTGNGLASAPITDFDQVLLSHAGPNWKKAALIVGKGLRDFWDARLIQSGDLELAARIRALADDGRLEARGDLFDLRNSEVRLPATQTATPMGENPA